MLFKRLMFRKGVQRLRINTLSVCPSARKSGNINSTGGLRQLGALVQPESIIQRDMDTRRWDLWCTSEVRIPELVVVSHLSREGKSKIDTFIVVVVVGVGVSAVGQ